VIRLGIVGTNFGRTVHLPAFRADPRCEVVALAGSDASRTSELARAAGVPKGYGDWRALVEDPNVQAVAIATLPSLQSAIAIRALELGKPVFAEKPMAGDLGHAHAMLQQAEKSGLPTMIDFNFHQTMNWQRAKQMLDQGTIGTLRHVTVHWHVESYSIQKRMRNWKTAGDDGGGVLGNFISHCFHYLEWFVGPLAGLSARISGLPDDPKLETTVTMALAYKSGPAVSLSMSCASYLGIGHRIEFSARTARWCCTILDWITCAASNCFTLSDLARHLNASPSLIQLTRNFPRAGLRRRRGWPSCFSTRPKMAARLRPDLRKAIACRLSWTPPGARII